MGVHNKDQFFFSPDVGRLVQRGGRMYTEHGAVFPSDAWVRLMPVDAGSYENYANWSDEHRRGVLEAYEESVRQAKAAEEKRRAHRDTLVAQARDKLTVEEFEAVYDNGFEDGRY
jgi:hypothetical protein